MNTLLLRLEGPMQSWGVQSRFGMRDTESEPSKSGVIGLLCAALGLPRSANLENLVALRMGVRVDREGKISVDYQTAQNVLKSAGGIKGTELSNRYYLADAAFLVGLEGSDLVLLNELHNALRDPQWSLYLGRKAFVPGSPVWLPDGLRLDQTLIPTLKDFPLLKDPGTEDKLRLVIEDPLGDLVRPDIPISFSQRSFALRRVKVLFIDPPTMQAESIPQEVI